MKAATKTTFELAGEPRAQLGRTDSRRLRKAGKVPAIMYGGGEAPERSSSITTRSATR